MSDGLKLCSKIDFEVVCFKCAKEGDVGGLYRNMDDLRIYCKKFSRELVRDESKDPYPFYLPQWEKYEYYSKVTVLIFLDPSKMYPDAEVLDCRIKGGGMGLISQLLSVVNGIPTVVCLWHCSKELLLKTIRIHLWLSETIQEDIGERNLSTHCQHYIFCWHSFTKSENQDYSQSFYKSY